MESHRILKTRQEVRTGLLRVQMKETEAQGAQTTCSSLLSSTNRARFQISNEVRLSPKSRLFYPPPPQCAKHSDVVDSPSKQRAGSEDRAMILGPGPACSPSWTSHLTSPSCFFPICNRRVINMVRVDASGGDVLLCVY